MAERILSSAATDFAQKIMAMDRYSGDDSELSLMAYDIYLERLSSGTPGSPEDDWKKAEKMRLSEIITAVMDEQHS